MTSAIDVLEIDNIFRNNDTLGSWILIQKMLGTQKISQLLSQLVTWIVVNGGCQMVGPHLHHS